MQVFSTYMHLKAASAGVTAGQATSISAEEASAKVDRFCAIAQSVAEVELHQLGLPIMR